MWPWLSVLIIKKNMIEKRSGKKGRFWGLEVIIFCFCQLLNWIRMEAFLGDQNGIKIRFTFFFIVLLHLQLYCFAWSFLRSCLLLNMARGAYDNCLSWKEYFTTGGQLSPVRLGIISRIHNLHGQNLFQVKFWSSRRMTNSSSGKSCEVLFHGLNCRSLRQMSVKKSFTPCMKSKFDTRTSAVFIKLGF